MFIEAVSNRAPSRCVEPIKTYKTYKTLQEIVVCVYFLIQRPLPLL